MKMISESFFFVQINFGAVPRLVAQLIWSRIARIGIRDLTDICGILIGKPETKYSSERFNHIASRMYGLNGEIEPTHLTASKFPKRPIKSSRLFCSLASVDPMDRSMKIMGSDKPLRRFKMLGTAS